MSMGGSSAQCTLQIVGAYRYCGVTPPDPDTDGDGISDSIDVCPLDTYHDGYNNPCSHNEDGDGFPDDSDICPGDAVHDAIGNACNHNEDSDSFPDDSDVCPFDSFHDNKGSDPCNHDEDGDGFSENGSDLCPSQAGTVQGCLDSDGDLVPNTIDACPNVAAPGTGCPAYNPNDDSDVDGFINSVDACPTEKGTIEGCPDPDSDGVRKPIDRCPNDPAPGVADGCPLPEMGETIFVPPVVNTDPETGEVISIIVPAEEEEKGPISIAQNSECSVASNSSNDVPVYDAPGGNHINTLADNLAYTISGQDGSTGELWYEVSMGGGSTSGWVQSILINVGGQCDTSISTSGGGLNVDAAMADCPENTELVESRPTHVQAWLISGDDACGNVETVVTYNVSMMASGYTAADVAPHIPGNMDQKCPGAVPGLAKILTTVGEFGGIGVMRKLEGYFTEDNACEVAEQLHNGEIPTIFPPEILNDLAISTCTPDVTEDRYDALYDTMLTLGFANDLLSGTNVCTTLHLTNQIGTPTPDQNDLYNWLLNSCNLSASVALNTLTYAIMIGADISFDASLECSDPLEYINSHTGENVIQPEPDALILCQDNVVQIFLKNHLPYLEQEDVQRIYADANPCEALEEYMNNGHLPERIIAPPPPTPPPGNTPGNNPTQEPGNPGGSNPPVASPVQPGYTYLLGFFPPVTPAPNKPLPQATSPDDVGGIVAEVVPEPPDFLKDAYAVFVAHAEDDSAITSLYLWTGETYEMITPLPDGEKRSPLLYRLPDGNSAFLIYLLIDETGSASLRVTLLTDGQPPQTTELLKDIDFTINPDSRLAITRDGTILVTLIDAEGVPGIYPITFDQDRVRVAWIANGFNPSISRDGKIVAFERIENGQNKVYYFIVLSGQIVPLTVDGLPDDCHAPAFDASEISPTTYFTCANTDSGSQVYAYTAEGELLSIPIDHEPIRNILPGPVPGYISFDDGSKIFYIPPEGEISKELIQIEGQEVYQIYWVH